MSFLGQMRYVLGVLECVVNISEGRALETLAALAQLAGPDLLDAHCDPDHNRSVFTLFGTEAIRDITRGAVEVFNIHRHTGQHPRIGIVDVVPFVPLEDSTMAEAIQARNDFAQFAANELGIPCFLYGPERTLPEIRKNAFKDLAPDIGPKNPHPTAGAICVGARDILIAYNVLLQTTDVSVAKQIAASIRSEHVRALGMTVNGHAQVSMNLIRPYEVGPADVYDQIATKADIDSAELVGLVPSRVLISINKSRWQDLGLSIEKTIEWQLAERNRRWESTGKRES